jgi:hypothetical protein
MELFIRVKDGQPFEHPILGDNFRYAFPDVDVNNLPVEFARFERVEMPPVGVYEVYEGVTYELHGAVYKDVHRVRPMNEQEKIALQNSVKDRWAKEGYPSWTFDESICAFVPPIPYPIDGKLYYWDEPTTYWLEVVNA